MKHVQSMVHLRGTWGQKPSEVRQSLGHTCLARRPMVFSDAHLGLWSCEGKLVEVNVTYSARNFAVRHLT